MTHHDTIAAIATAKGGAISLIRLSGVEAVAVADKIFRSRSARSVADQKPFTIQYGNIVETDQRAVDDVLLSVFRAPHSYTGQDMVEISCHGSTYIEQRILSLLLENGARLADAGEFTLRAFLNGKMDLVQAEAVAEVIASTSRANHRIAVNQMRGGYSREFSLLRGRLLDFASLLELELDFGEEEVEFANREQLSGLISQIKSKIEHLLQSFKLGNARKNGVPVAIVGRPNAGKSTLLNALLNEDRALVSNIAGTTRDVIEETLNIDGVTFRFIDTAGIRQTADLLENMGIERTFERISKAEIVILVVDCTDRVSDIAAQVTELSLNPTQKLYIALNKIDARSTGGPDTDETGTDGFDAGEIDGADNQAQNERKSGFLSQATAPAKNSDQAQLEEERAQIEEERGVSSLSCSAKTRRQIQVEQETGLSVLTISAKTGHQIDTLKQLISSDYTQFSKNSTEDILISNLRHYELLAQALQGLTRASEGLTTNLPTDLVSQDIREVVTCIGLITGEITTDDILGNIFSKFCIGK